MPVLQPAEPWRKTGRIEIEELFKLTDRKGSELVLAMTHEEAVTFHIAQTVRSYRDLPLAALPLPGQGARRAPPPRGGAAHARVRDEGRLHLRPRRRRAGGQLRPAGGRLRPHHGAHRPALLPRRGRRRDDGRQRRARVHGALRRGGGRGGADRVGVRGQRRGGARAAGPATSCGRARSSTASRCGSSPRSRSPTSSSSAPATPSRSERATSTSTAPSTRSGWAPTGSARRAWLRPRSSSTPTSTASPGRARSRRSRCTSWRSASPARPSATPPTGCTRRCARGGVEVLYDDRDVGTGEKFADAELLGCPLRLTVGRKSLESGEVEVQLRRGRQSAPGLPLGADSEVLLRAVDELCQTLP